MSRTPLDPAKYIATDWIVNDPENRLFNIAIQEHPVESFSHIGPTDEKCDCGANDWSYALIHFEDDEYLDDTVDGNHEAMRIYLCRECGSWTMEPH